MNTNETMNALIENVNISRDRDAKITSINITLKFYVGGLSIGTNSQHVLVDPNTYVKNLLLVAGVKGTFNLMGRYIRVNKMRPGQRLEFMQHILNDDIKMNLKGEMIHD